MSERRLGPWDVAAAALVIGGAITMLMPQYGASVLRLVIVTAAAAACVHALTLNVPVTWSSPFDGATRKRSGTPTHTDGVEWTRSRLSARRQTMAKGPPLPPEILRILQPLIRTSIGQNDPYVEDRKHAARFRRALSPLTWAVLNADGLKQPHWFQTRWPNPREVATVVHRVLDDLESLAAGGGGPHHHAVVEPRQEP